ncbi:hypothetical protein [Megasphaera vaginalis (ex Bordigoni et al. 2020)]|uniref:hypothetical protein n=1 Tax=Megasphaera vaginalis (ex Bordigoni et al. 2020) TaxID=2045301 RepID=UPI000C7C8769|nr:hypothetical protein [Megasphaera vaginalis (ex Bordigoni et al. 2020)]
MGFLDAFYQNKPAESGSDKIYNRAYRLFNSPEEQNQLLPENIRNALLQGRNCDEIDGSGEFGKVPTNPIPVNGSFGEWSYLSKLRLADTGGRLFFHKVRTIGDVDVFVVVSGSGKHAALLYFDPGHPRPSGYCPEGYILEREAVFPRGITTTYPEFPKGLYGRIKKEAKQRLHVDIAEKEAKQIAVAEVRKALRQLKGYES